MLFRSALPFAKPCSVLYYSLKNPPKPSLDRLVGGTFIYPYHQVHLISMITRKAFPRNPWNRPDLSCSLVPFVPATDLPSLSEEKLGIVPPPLPQTIGKCGEAFKSQMYHEILRDLKPQGSLMTAMSVTLCGNGALRDLVVPFFFG